MVKVGVKIVVKGRNFLKVMGRTHRRYCEKIFTGGIFWLEGQGGHDVSAISASKLTSLPKKFRRSS